MNGQYTSTHPWMTLTGFLCAQDSLTSASAIQNTPMPLELMLSGQPGRLSANTSDVPALSPVSQYLWMRYLRHTKHHIALDGHGIIPLECMKIPPDAVHTTHSVGSERVVQNRNFRWFVMMNRLSAHACCGSYCLCFACIVRCL